MPNGFQKLCYYPDEDIGDMKLSGISNESDNKIIIQKDQHFKMGITFKIMNVNRKNN